MNGLSTRMKDTLQYVWAETPNVMKVHANTLAALRARDFITFVKIDNHIHVAITNYGKTAYEWASMANLMSYKQCLTSVKDYKTDEKDRL